MMLPILIVELNDIIQATSMYTIPVLHGLVILEMTH